MKDGLIKKSLDASVAAKTKELTKALERAGESIQGLLRVLQHEMFTQLPWDAAITLQVLADAATRHARTVNAHKAQLTALMRMQEAANAEYTGEEKA